VELPKKKSKNLLTGVRVLLIFPRMKLLRFSLAILLAAGFSANAQTTATTDPVGFVSYTVNANSDQKVGVPMQQASAFQGTAATVSGTTVSAAGITSLSGANLLLVTSGTAQGKWEQIVSSAAGTVTLAASIPNFSNGNSFVIKPFWTLNTLFPNGGSLPKSQDPEAPVAYILVNNPAAVGINLPSAGTCFYYDGTGDLLPAGWYADGSFESADNFVLSPETFITIRNGTSSAVNVSFVGSVPVDGLGLDVTSTSSGPQDNLIYNQFPSDVTLANSDLVSSGVFSPSPDPEAPTDLLLVYSLNSSGQNPPTSASYIYVAAGGPLAAGWYTDGSFESANNVVLPAGGSYIIRKAAGANQTKTFIPTVPYTLN
jgi:uncharacterized protein (TIGR02597 family)